MLKEIHIENYKSLKNVTIQFKEGLNIIIGKNGSGKSNLLELIDRLINKELFFGKSISSVKKFPNINFGYVFEYENEVQERIELAVELPSKHFDSRLTLGRKMSIYERSITNNEELLNEEFADGLESSLEHSISSAASKSYVSRGISGFSAAIFILQRIHQLVARYIKFSFPRDMFWLDKHNTVTLEKPFGVVSDNDEQFSSLFGYGFRDYLQNWVFSNLNDINENEDEESLKSMIILESIRYIDQLGLRDLLSAFSPIVDIQLSPGVSCFFVEDKVLIDYLSFEFKIENAWVPWSYLSDGTKRLFYLISEINACNNGIILLDEPELGIHPHQLYKLMQFIKEQSQQKQIIISTHSPLVLDMLEADELDRIIIARTENGSSQFNKLTDEQIEKAKVYMHEEMDLSFYWLHSDLEAE